MLHSMLRTDVVPDGWNASYAALSVARYVEGRREKLDDMLARHRELEQSESKAQAALLSILTLTQITELKLLLDIGHHAHKFYVTVLSLLLVCICLEILAGVIIIYIGNIHYRQSRRTSRGRGGCDCALCPLSTCCRPRGGSSSGGYYQTVGASATDPLVIQGSTVNWMDEDDHTTSCLCCPRRRDSGLRQKILMTSRATGTSAHNMMDESSSSRTTGEVEMKMYGAGGGLSAMTSSVGCDRPEQQQQSARGGGAGGISGGVGGPEKSDKLSFNMGADDEMEKLRGMSGDEWYGSAERSAKQPSLTETAQQRALDIIDQMNTRQDSNVFLVVSFWKNITMYIIYFVILMNIFIVTFGISGR